MGPLSLLQRANWLTVWAKPFPHIILHDPLMRKKMPPFPKVAIDKGHVGRLSACDYDGEWNDFVKYQTSQEFYNDVADTFRELMPKELQKTQVGLRGRTKKAGQMDCQFVENPPSDKPYAPVVPHIDNPREVYAGMWYFRHPDDNTSGEFTFYVPQGPVEVEDTDGYKRVVKSKIKPVLNIPYDDNLFIMFLNGKHAIHGATREASEFPRRYINVICDLRRPLFGI